MWGFDIQHIQIRNHNYGFGEASCNWILGPLCGDYIGSLLLG